jgi:hypothetical protein
MKIVCQYNFNNGLDYITNFYEKEYSEIQKIISSIDASQYKTKESSEKTMIGRMLFSPRELNSAFKNAFSSFGWKSKKVQCDYIYGTRLDGYVEPHSHQNAFREMDFVKDDCKLGIEVQFGKYAFMVYNVCAKMTIFKNLGIIDAGIEIVPVKNFADEMSTGVSYFEQFAWDLHTRGVSNIDTPVLVLGIDE